MVRKKPTETELVCGESLGVPKERPFAVIVQYMISYSVLVSESFQPDVTANSYFFVEKRMCFWSVMYRKEYTKKSIP